MSTTPQQAKEIVIVGVLGTGVVAAVGSARQGSVPPTSIGIGVLVSGAMLLGLAQVAPGLAAGFAALLLTTAMFVTGAGTWQAITNITK